jgi:hypothetical protein
MRPVNFSTGAHRHPHRQIGRFLCLRGSIPLLPPVEYYYYLCTSHNNTQNKMSCCRPTPAALPHISMATSAMDPNHGAADPYESTAGVGRPGSLLPRLVPLVGPTNKDASKIKEGGGSSALGGRRWVLRHNNQPIVGGSDRRDDGEYVWPGWSVGGGCFSYFGEAN